MPRRLRLQVWRGAWRATRAAAEGGFFAPRSCTATARPPTAGARGGRVPAVTDLYGTRMRTRRAPRAAPRARARRRRRGRAPPAHARPVAARERGRRRGRRRRRRRAGTGARRYGPRPRNASALAAARAERGGGAAEAVFAAGDGDGALLDVDETDAPHRRATSCARCVNALNATAWAAARRRAPQFAASVDELAAPAAGGDGAAWLLAWRLEAVAARRRARRVRARRPRRLARRESVSRGAAVRTRRAPAGGCSRRTTIRAGARGAGHDRRSRRRATCSRRARRSARWAPAVVAVALAGAHAEVRPSSAGRPHPPRRRLRRQQGGGFGGNGGLLRVHTGNFGPSVKPAGRCHSHHVNPSKARAASGRSRPLGGAEPRVPEKCSTKRSESASLRVACTNGVSETRLPRTAALAAAPAPVITTAQRPASGGGSRARGGR